MLLNQYKERKSSISLYNSTNKVSTTLRSISEASKLTSFTPKPSGSLTPIILPFPTKKINRSCTLESKCRVISPNSNIRLTKIFNTAPINTFSISPSDENFIPIILKTILTCCQQCQQIPCSIEFIKEKTLSLYKILTIVQDIDIFSKISPNYQKNIFDMAFLNINRKIFIPKLLYFNLDEIPFNKDINWNFINISYKILLSIYQNNNSFSSFNVEFLISLVNLFSTPDEDERTFLISLVVDIIQSQNILFSWFLSQIKIKIRNHRFNSPDPFSIRTILFIFYKIYNSSLSSQNLNEYFDLIKFDIFPLISDNFFITFSQIFQDLILFFIKFNFNHKNFDSIKFIIEKILKYWPISKSLSQPIFIILLIDSFKNLNDKLKLIYINRSFSFLSDSILSNNQKVSEISIQSIMSWDFRDIIKKFYYFVHLYLIPATKINSINHWSKSIRDTSILCLKFLNDNIINYSGDIVLEKNQKEKNRINNWKLIEKFKY